MKLFSTLILSATLLTPPVHASLDAKIKTAGKKYFGTIIDLNTINDATYSNLASSEFGAVTAEYSFKWNHTEGTSPTSSSQAGLFKSIPSSW
jgi:endo-1,4-beta-xylanase